VFLQAFNSLTENREFNAKFMPLLVEKADEEGEVSELFNPEIFKQEGTVSTLGTFEHKRPMKRNRQFPRWVKRGSIDAKIVSYLKEGYKYQKIAAILCLTTSAVTNRIEKMRNRLIPENDRMDAAESVYWAATNEIIREDIAAKRAATAAKIDKLLAYKK
jgi:hypothetical protein